VKKDADYRERLRAAGRRYRDSHKEELRARRRRRWKVDPAYRERIGAAQRRYRESHKEELRERRRRKWEADPAYREKLRAARRRYRESHTEELRERHHRKWEADPVYREKVRAARRRYRASHREELRARGREWRRKKDFREVYRMTLEDYDVMLAQQDGACAICRRKPKERLVVDHCHATGQVRGLLCAKCNSGLGFYQDNPDRLLAATAYLESSRGDATAQRDGADVTDAGPSADGPSSLPIKG
jgi:hypothetical protein